MSATPDQSPPDPGLLHRGTGPVATVYMTVPPAGGRAAAVKVYPERLDGETASELLDEQRTLATLRSVSSILLIDQLAELPDGRVAVWMELCTQSLAELVEVGGPLPVPDVVTLAETVAAVLTDTHTTGIVHGGVTPTNILFRSAGQPVLADFGLGLRQRFPRQPEAAAGYCAPEVLRGDEPTESADLYGLGAVLHFALTGSSPFPTRTGEPVGEMLLRALSDPPPTISGSDLPPALPALVGSLLAKDPAHRPQSAAHVLDVLRELAEKTGQDEAGRHEAGPAGDTGPDFDDFRYELPPVRESTAGTAALIGSAATVGALNPDLEAPAAGLELSGDMIEAPGAQPENRATEPKPEAPAAPEIPTPQPEPSSALQQPQAGGATSQPSPVPPSQPPSKRTSRNQGPIPPGILAAVAVLSVVVVLVGALGSGDSQDSADARGVDATTEPDARPSTDPSADPSTGPSTEPSTAPAEDPGPSSRPTAAPTGQGNDPSLNTPPSSADPASAMKLAIYQLIDHGDRIELSWRSAEPLTYAVFVAEEGGGQASARYQGPATTMTVPVDPGLTYCFQVQGTDGFRTYESPPRSIRGAKCNS